MKCEPLTIVDEEELRKIWEKHYKDEFAFPDFFKHYLCAFKFLDDAGNIITAGGVRTIPEVVLLTNKESPAITRMRTLRNALDFVRHIAYKNNYHHVHATFKDGDSAWEKALRRYGFQDMADNILVRRT